MIAGLDIEADKGPGNYTGRTFIGAQDADGNGTYETILILVTAHTNQYDAADVLYAFGATQQIMFDGGGSSQLIVQGVSRVSSSRTIPLRSRRLSSRSLGALPVPTTYSSPRPLETVIFSPPAARA